MLSLERSYDIRKPAYHKRGIRSDPYNFPFAALDQLEPLIKFAFALEYLLKIGEEYLSVRCQTYAAVGAVYELNSKLAFDHIYDVS